jgi:hypothetical protein
VHTHTFAELIDDAVLVSAHDVHHGLVEDSDVLQRDASRSVYANARLLFVDSGLYESREDSDTYEPLSHASSDLEWSEEFFVEVANKLDTSGPPIALVSWDRYTKYEEQIARALEFFTARKQFASVILLKPETERSPYDLNALRPHIADLRGFSIIGVTEKELGTSIIDRLVAVARLRADLDAEGVDSPIHIFGALDPLFTPLYFAFGGEIFDGLAWLRYGFHEELLVHQSAMPLLNRDIDAKLQRAANITQASNLSEIRKLRRSLVRFVEREESWDDFAQGRTLAAACDDVESELARRGVT